MNFVKNIFHGHVDEEAHRQFIRFGRGEYNRRALLSLWKTKSIKVKASFEFANDFVIFAAGINNVTFTGDIWSKEEIEDLFGGVKRGGKYIYNVRGLSGSEIKNLENQVYYYLLNADGPGVKLRIKTKLPKPGKGENKIDEKFCQMELDEKHYSDIKNEFFWEIPDCKKVSVEHRFIITDIVVPKNEKETDYAKIREMAKRRGKIVRTANVDGKEIIKEITFEV